MIVSSLAICFLLEATQYDRNATSLLRTYSAIIVVWAVTYAKLKPWGFNQSDRVTGTQDARVSAGAAVLACVGRVIVRPLQVRGVISIRNTKD